NELKVLLQTNDLQVVDVKNELVFEPKPTQNRAQKEPKTAFCRGLRAEQAPAFEPDEGARRASDSTLLGVRRLDATFRRPSAPGPGAVPSADACSLAFTSRSFQGGVKPPHSKALRDWFVLG